MQPLLNVNTSACTVPCAAPCCSVPWPVHLPTHLAALLVGARCPRLSSIIQRTVRGHLLKPHPKRAVRCRAIASCVLDHWVWSQYDGVHRTCSMALSRLCRRARYFVRSPVSSLLAIHQRARHTLNRVCAPMSACAVLRALLTIGSGRNSMASTIHAALPCRECVGVHGTSCVAVSWACSQYTSVHGTLGIACVLPYRRARYFVRS